MRVDVAVAERGYAYGGKPRALSLPDGNEGYALVEGTEPYDVEFVYSDGMIYALTCSLLLRRKLQARGRPPCCSCAKCSTALRKTMRVNMLLPATLPPLQKDASFLSLAVNDKTTGAHAGAPRGR